MKKILVSLFVVFAFFEAVVAMAAFTPRNLGWSTISIASGTLNEICISTPPTVGYPRWCTNCAAGDGKGMVVWSTSTAAPGAGCDFTLSTGTQAK